MKYLLSIILPLISVPLFAQNVDITETFTNDFVPSKNSAQSDSRYWIDDNAVGVQSILTGDVCDQLTSYFDRIEEYHPQNADTLSNRYYRAIFGTDTLCYKERREVIISTYAGKRILEVESKVAPYQRFSVAIDGLNEEAVDKLIAQIQQMKSSEIALNNAQTCIFYALNLLFNSHNIDTAPIITRNTNFTDGRQLNAFFTRFLDCKASLPCKYKMLRNVDLPDKSILVFQNAHNEYIHAVFYRKNPHCFYTKNGQFAPLVINDIRPIMERYSMYDTKQDLSKSGLDGLADTVLIFTIKE